MYDGWQYFADLEGGTTSSSAEAYDLGIYPSEPVLSAYLTPGVSINFTWDTGEKDSEGYPVSQYEELSLLDPQLEADFKASLEQWVGEVDAHGIPDGVSAVEYSRNAGVTAFRNEDYQYYADETGGEVVGSIEEAYDLGVYPGDPNTSSIDFYLDQRALQAYYDDGALRFRVNMQNL